MTHNHELRDKDLIKRQSLQRALFNNAAEIAAELFEVSEALKPSLFQPLEFVKRIRRSFCLWRGVILGRGDSQLPVSLSARNRASLVSSVQQGMISADLASSEFVDISQDSSEGRVSFVGLSH